MSLALQGSAGGNKGGHRNTVVLSQEQHIRTLSKAHLRPGMESVAAAGER